MNGAIISMLSSSIAMNSNYSYSYSETNTKEHVKQEDEELYKKGTPEEIQVNKDKMAEYDKQLIANQKSLLQ